MAHNCENCKFRAHYDKKPNSLLGKFWRWHINFCPGWKGYFTSQSEEKKAAHFGQSDDFRRDELIRIIEHSVEKLTLAELEALYYDMTTKSYINDN